MLWFMVWHPIRLLFVVASHHRRGTSSSQGTVTFTVGEEVYSLDLSSPSSRNVSKGDAFNGNADLHVTCSPEIMKKMIAKIKAVLGACCAGAQSAGADMAVVQAVCKVVQEMCERHEGFVAQIAKVDQGLF